MKTLPLNENIPIVPVWPRVRRNISWACKHTDAAIVSLGRSVKAKLFPSRLSKEEKFMLSFGGDKRFQSSVSPLAEQISLARALVDGEEAKEAIISRNLPYTDAQVIAIKKLDTLQQADEVIASGVIHHPQSLIALQVRYHELGGKLNRS